jgi:hypothetical protein
VYIVISKFDFERYRVHFLYSNPWLRTAHYSIQFENYAIRNEVKSCMKHDLEKVSKHIQDFKRLVLSNKANYVIFYVKYLPMKYHCIHQG